MVGQTISHYTILEKLGEGGMGVVYRAHDTMLDRDVALKFLPAYLTSDPTEKERLYHEARAASALSHPNITTIYEINEHEGQLFIAMEYVEGKTLRQLVESESLSIKKVLDIAIQIGEGLAAAHEKGVVHRDIKSDNILLTPKGQAKIMDFGLAKVKGDMKLTKTGSTVGTAAYMSPEQVQAAGVDHRSDIFSIGVVLYEMLTGKLPFRGEHHAALMYSIVNEEPQPIARFNEKVSPEIEHVVSKALMKEKEERYQHVDDLLADLRRERKKIEYALSGYISRTAPPGGPKLVLKRRFWKTAVGIAGILLIAIIGVYLLLPKSVQPPTISKSIAVLPFKNVSDNKADEYFSDGITDDIIAQLSKITDLKVISRTSMMQYKGTSKNIREIGKELDVGAVLEGSVRHEGNQVRIVAQLIDARQEGHLWAETYDKEMTQIFAVQSDVAQSIAAALKAKLAPGEKERIEKPQTENTEAYQLYLKGRFYWNKRTLEDFKRGIECFTQAVQKDPHYALAYAGLASTYVLFPVFYGGPPREYGPKAEAAARRALEIDPSIGEAHAVLGSIKCNFEWDWSAAETEFKRAIELDPGNPTTHQWYSEYLSCQSRLEESLAEAKRAQELDPLSMIINFSVARALFLMGQLEKARDQCKRGIELDPNFPWTYLYLGRVYQAQGESDQAIAAYERAISLAGREIDVLGGLGHAYAKAGRHSDALSVLQELKQYSEQGYPAATEIAAVYNGLGEREETLHWLEKAFQERSYTLTDLKTEPLWDNLRSEPRFVALLKKMGLDR